MAGRPKRRARLARSKGYTASGHTGGRAPGNAERFEAALRERKARIESGRGCSTRGYDPTSLLEGQGASRSKIAQHVRTLPSFLREEEVHVTGSGNVQILTFCRFGRLESMVEGD